jgi:hypothetical protein
MFHGLRFALGMINWGPPEGWRNNQIGFGVSKMNQQVGLQTRDRDSHENQEGLWNPEVD